MLEKVRNDVCSVLTDPAFAQSHATSRGLNVVAGDAMQLKRAIQQEVQLAAEQVKAAGVTPE